MIAALGIIAVVIGGMPASSPIRVQGRVVRIVAGDTLSVAGVRVVVHRVTADKQGPIDTTFSNRAGRFSAMVTADSTAVLLASSRWDGVEYFAQPMSPVAGTVDFLLVVADTSSIVPVSLVARHVIIGAPASDGSRDVVDLIVLGNANEQTRVAVDSTAATFRMVMPLNITRLNIGDADFSADAFTSLADTVALHAPIPPGERQFILTYQLAPGALALRLPLAPVPDTLSLLTEEPDLSVQGGPIRVGAAQVSGRVFERYAAGRAALASNIVVTLPGKGSVPSWLLPALVAVVVLGLAFGTSRMILPRRH